MRPFGLGEQSVVDALDAGEGIADRGFTFLDAKGAEVFLSYDALRAEVMARGDALRGLGLKKGDRVALVLPEARDFVCTFLGALWQGIVPVPLYPPFSLGKLDVYRDTLVHILRRAEPKALVTNARLKPMLWEAVGQIPAIERVVAVDELLRPDRIAHPRPRLGAEDLCFLQFTSGSTSEPKGVMVTHGSLAANCLGIVREGSRMTSQDVAVSWLPLYHDMGLIGFVLSPIFAKASVVLLPTLSFVRNATLWMDAIHDKRGTLAFAPNFAFALVSRRAKPEQLARWDLSSLRLVGCGAEPIQAGVLRTFLTTFAPCGLKAEALLPAYGMAEATLAVTFASLCDPMTTDRIDAGAYERTQLACPAGPEDRAVEVVSCGRPFEGHEVAVFGPSDEKLPERAVGEIRVRGPSVTPGYFNDPDATARAFRDGWLRTGDLGYLAEGQLYITGRAKDVIIIRGRKWDPQRIEWLTNEVPGVRPGSAVAFSRPGTESEELVVCAEIKDEPAEGLDHEISKRLNEQLQIVPADIALVSAGVLPKTSSGKLQRQKTRKLYLAGELAKGHRPPESLALARHMAGAWAGRARHVAREFWRELLGEIDR